MAGFPKRARLLTKADYNTVFSKSVKVSNSLFLILIHNNNKAHVRLGLVVSKKVDKRAVQRNRIKRIARETFRNFKFDSNCDFVVLAKPSVSQSTNRQVFDGLNQLWQQAQNKIKKIRKKQ